ncbi:hypothetical protein NHX12_003132 [Muraenolepis orangiensis]|uniref:Alpha-and gamma-adaptin-binding protein p34 n=1 Tax=Muraenolepis orangiensis TaxID=630683 RepID=A0A9Q0IG61_9TELE|nr:hypothetical protein NHX12_003132 [Muraenolepis orangiensis]
MSSPAEEENAEHTQPSILVTSSDPAFKEDELIKRVSRHAAHQWCLAHAFELVELNPQDLPDEDDDFPESTGVKRILQALNANVWASVEMKDEHNQGFGLMSSLVANRHNNFRSGQDPPVRDRGSGGHANLSFVQSSSSPAEGANESAVPAVRETEGSTPARVETIVDPMTHLDIQELANLTAGDADVENFERLFSKLKEMKDKASSLPHEQRKVHAEKVAKAFWMAIGGEEDEVEDLSSGEES